MPPGIEYTIHDSQEPHLFVIHKQMRDTPKKTTSLTFYYILDGRIYQAPPLHAAMSSRMVGHLCILRFLTLDLHAHH